MSSELGSALRCFCDKFWFKFFQRLASSLDETTHFAVAIDIGTVLVSTFVSAQSRVRCCPPPKIIRSSDTLSVSAHDLATVSEFVAWLKLDPVKAQIKTTERGAKVFGLL